MTGNTRVISQKALQTFQDEMGKIIKDPYKVNKQVVSVGQSQRLSCQLHSFELNEREGYWRSSLSRVTAGSQMLFTERTGWTTTLGTLSPTLCDYFVGSSCISCVRLQDNPCSTFPSGFYCNVQASNCRVVKKVLYRWGLYERREQSVLVVALCLLACWPKYSHFACCIESFSLIPSSRSPSTLVIILVSMGLVSVPLIVPLGVADCRVAMDTSLYPDDHFPHHQP